MGDLKSNHVLDILEAVCIERQYKLQDELRFNETIKEVVTKSKEESNAAHAKVDLLKEALKEKEEESKRQRQIIAELQQNLELQKAINAKSKDLSFQIELADTHGAKIKLEMIIYAIANLAEPLLVMHGSKKRVPITTFMDIISNAFHINFKSYQSEISHALVTKSLPDHLNIFELLSDVITERYNNALE